MLNLNRDRVSLLYLGRELVPLQGGLMTKGVALYYTLTVGV